MSWFTYFGTLQSTAICILNIIVFAEALRGHNIKKAGAHEFPFIASLIKKNCHHYADALLVCTGSFVTNKHMVTAEHCLEDFQPKDLQVVAGIVDLRAADRRYNIKTWITYNEWSIRSKVHQSVTRNDIAVVAITKPVQLLTFRPVALTNLNKKQLYRSRATIAGWGITNTGNSSRFLNKAKVEILTNEECKKRSALFMNIHLQIPEMYLCSAASPISLLDCGDSGGPLLDQNNVLVGINYGCGPKYSWGDFDKAFLDKYKVNIHPSIDYYKHFIIDVVPDTPVGIILSDG